MINQAIKKVTAKKRKPAVSAKVRNNAAALAKVRKEYHTLNKTVTAGIERLEKLKGVQNAAWVKFSDSVGDISKARRFMGGLPKSERIKRTKHIGVYKPWHIPTSGRSKKK